MLFLVYFRCCGKKYLAVNFKVLTFEYPIYITLITSNYFPEQEVDKTSELKFFHELVTRLDNQIRGTQVVIFDDIDYRICSSVSS